MFLRIFIWAAVTILLYPLVNFIFVKIGLNKKNKPSGLVLLISTFWPFWVELVIPVLTIILLYILFNMVVNTFSRKTTQ